MKKMTCFLFILLLSCSSLFAQKNRNLHTNQDFLLATPSYKIPNSLYRTITCLDSRKDTANLGFVQSDPLGKTTSVVPGTPLSVQLKTMLDSMTDGTAMNGRLLLQIKQFTFVGSTPGQRGYCALRAILYADSNDLYLKIASIDTIMVTKPPFATTPLLNHGSRLIPEFVEANLLNVPAATDTYTMFDLINIDSVDKQKIKLYTTTTFADGVYLTYQSFKTQIPDKPITARIKDEKIVKVSTIDSAGKWIKVKPGSVYGVVYQGVPYAATDYGFYPLEKMGSDLFFIGDAKVAPNPGDIIIGDLILGVLGALTNIGAHATFEMQIDYFSGRFIKLRKIDLPPEVN